MRARQPRPKIRSLWDMVKVDGCAFMVAIMKLKRCADDIAKDIGCLDTGLLTTRREMELDNVRAIIETLSSLDNKLAVRKAKDIELGIRFQGFLESDHCLPMPRMFDELKERIEQELEGRLIYAFDEYEAKCINKGKDLFDPFAVEAFPSTKYELEEAAQCLGHARYTACVFSSNESSGKLFICHRPKA